MGRNRAERRGKALTRKREVRPQDALLVWRGVLLVSIGGAGLAGVGSWYYATLRDPLVAGLFTLATLALLGLGVYAIRRVGRLSRA